MTQIALWYERKFSFSFPSEIYPNVIVRLRGTPARLEEMLSKAPRASLIQKAAGKWSAQEHLGHLLDLEPLWSARVEDFKKEGQTLTVTDLTNRKTHEANHNASKVQDILAAFRTARINFVNHLANFQPAQFAGTKLHPRLQQPMRLVDHLYFVAEHDDHHLAQIWELLR
jgi:uncharacterized damage-inducible protein DinB